MHTLSLRVIVYVFVCNEAYRLRIPSFKAFNLSNKCLFVATEDTLITNSLLIYGVGYVGAVVAKKASSLNYSVQGTFGSRKVDDSSLNGIYQFDTIEDHGDLLSTIQPTHILITIPPSIPTSNTNADYSSPSQRCNISDTICQGLLSYQKRYPGRLLWLGYLSSTGVYIETNGGMVDENSPTFVSSKGNVIDLKISTMNAKAVSRAWVERQWYDYAATYNFPLHVFRLGGIYGPGRNLFKRLQSMQGSVSSVEVNSAVKVNRIHVDDIATVVCTSMAIPSDTTTNPMIINIVDDLPATQYDVLTYCKHLVSKTETSESIPSDEVLVQLKSDSNDSKSVAVNTSRTRGSNKIVSNSKLRVYLKNTGQTLQYPTYIE